MPTFSAIALDRMIEPGAASTSHYSKPPVPNQPPRMSPALYATPDAVPLPNSPSSSSSSFPPSPYIINHKSRAPPRRLLKSSSEANVADEGLVADVTIKVSPRRRKSTSFSFPITEATEEDYYGSFDFDSKPELDNAANDDLECENNNTPEPVTAKVDKESESEDFYDPGESASFTSNTDAGEDGSNRLATPVGEFYDAWDELSTDSGMQSSVHNNNIETELREIRLSLVMEIEKRKQTEEALEGMQTHWGRLREQLAQVGVFVPIDPTTSTNNNDMSLSEELRCQLEVARFVSDSLGRGVAKAEVEMEMEAMLETKNFEITRLSDRVNYYEAVNREMSQRNQEAIEVGRRERQKRKKRQRWIWGSIAATITLGSAALAWSYIPASRPSSEASQPLKDD
ncbi:uncharacterized protein LOC108806069 [Raphanus sativus]|uniref:Uncharacterized protein LOC108806069 n=1 Tax=Raphanus sativus TaxID=3726 RepID=A0A6J0JD95_RAPSA|nr:uncharacterized protein LOC108806069 [Raphanus sativus]